MATLGRISSMLTCSSEPDATCFPLPSVCCLPKLKSVFIFIHDKGFIHMPATNENCMPGLFENSCQLQYPSSYIRQYMLILSFKHEWCILHANLELCFPVLLKKYPWQQMVLLELGQVVCVFTSLIKYTAHLLCSPHSHNSALTGGKGGGLIERVCISFTATTGKIRGDKNQQICQN